MRLYDVEQAAQNGIVDAGKVDDKPLNSFGDRERLSGKKNKFGGFKV
jgi:hypothetical protein